MSTKKAHTEEPVSGIGLVNGSNGGKTIGIDIATIISSEANLDVELGEDTVVSVRWKPYVYTQKFIDEHAEKTIGETIPFMIKDWDLIYTPDPERPDHKEKVPVTQEGINMLPVQLITAIWRAMMDVITAPNRRATQNESTGGGSFM